MKASHAAKNFSGSAKKARRGIRQGPFETPDDWRAEHRNSLVQGGMADGTLQPD